MTSAVAERRIPWRLMVAVVVAMTVAVMLVIAGQRSIEQTAPDRSLDAATMSRLLVFEPQPDGTLIVRDGADATVLRAFAEDEGSFLRGVLRGLQRERRHLPPSDLAAAYELNLYDDGHLMLRDPLTHMRIDMRAFGIDNGRLVAGLLDQGDGTR